jgi:hypothetical protein
VNAALRLVRHYLLRRPHVPRHAMPEPLAPWPNAADPLIPFAEYRYPYSPKDAA